jgi:hypothetical protein
MHKQNQHALHIKLQRHTHTHTHTHTHAQLADTHKTHHILHYLYGLLLGGVLGSLHRDIVGVIFDLVHKFCLVRVGLRKRFFQPFDLLQCTIAFQ